MFSKRGISPIIATVLLIVLTLVAVSILAVFVIRFVNDNVNESDECFDVLGDLRFEETTGYNCGVPGLTAFSVRVDDEAIVGFKATVTNDGSAESPQVENGVQSDVIRMLGANFNEALEVPTRGGVRTYVLNGEYQSVEINALLRSGSLCNTRERLDIEPCTDQNIIDNINGP